MTEIRSIGGHLLFSFDENETTLANEVGRHKELRGASIVGASLIGANFYGANLFCADLRDTDLIGANLKGANLCGANLRGANLEGADLMGADLRCANLAGANFMYANLEDADLSNADFENAYFFGTNLVGAFGMPDIPLACPSKGSFTAWKKVSRSYSDYLVKLEIPEDARRSSATSNKCRCDKALVLDIENLATGEHPKRIVNHNYCECLYEVGKMVYPDSFDEDRWRECSHGIHFFVDRLDAIKY